MRTFILLLILLTQMVSCVSVEIGKSKAKRSHRYKYKAPKSPFYRIKDDAVDVVWISKVTGATLSIKSRCQPHMKTNLKKWLDRLSAGLGESKVISYKEVPLYNRNAIKVIIKSSFEGFENHLILTSFVKNSCQYIIALTALPKNFLEDQNVYEKFLTGFKAW